MEQERPKIFQSFHVVELSDEIEKRLENPPDKRKRSEYNEWKNELNLLIDRANVLAKHKIYKHVQ